MFLYFGTVSAEFVMVEGLFFHSGGAMLSSFSLPFSFRDCCFRLLWSGAAFFLFWWCCRRTVLPFLSFVFFAASPGGLGPWAGWLGRVFFLKNILCFRRLLCILVGFTLQDKVQGRVNDFEDGPWCGLDLVSGWRTFGMVSCCEWVFEVWDAPRDQQPTSHLLHAVHGFRPSLNAILCMSHHTTMNFVQVRNWQGPPRCYTSHPERMSFGTRLASRHFIHFMHSTMRDVVNICPHVKLDNHQVPDVVRFIQCFLNRQVRSLKSTCCQPSLDFGRFDVLWRTNNPAM